MPAFLATLLFGLKATALAAVITGAGRLLVLSGALALGFSAVSFVGISNLGDIAASMLTDQLDGLPDFAMRIFALCRLDTAFVMILAAQTFSATLGLTGALTRWRAGRPGSLTA